jgi:hypothetical protein
MDADVAAFISQAGSIANVVIALANICLVAFVMRQIALQKKFFLEQSRRDARTKISESWQRFTAEMSVNPNAAPRYWPAAHFWPKADHGQVNLLPAHTYMLNTLQNEFRFVEDGLHSEDNFIRTLSWFTGVINNEDELSCVEAIAKGVGFDRKFISLVEKQIAERRNEIRAAASRADTATGRSR